MNILLLNNENNGGGLLTHFVYLANMLKQKGHSVYVIRPLANGEKGRFEGLGEYYPLDLSAKNPMKFRKNLQVIKSIIRDKKIDIMHTHNRMASIYAQLAYRQTGIPFVWTLHLNNIPSDPVHRLLTFHGKKAIVVGSELIPFCTNHLKIPREEIAVVYNGVFEDAYREYSEEKKNRIREQYRVAENQKVIVLLSRLVPVKGHKTMISAAAKVEGDYVILFTGESMEPGYKEELQEMIRHKGLEDKIRFIGYVNPVDVLNISDLFVLPSENEGFGISMIESFFMHVPVIRTRTGGYEDVKEFVIPMENEKDLAENLKLFMEGKLDMREKVEKGYQFAVENCTCSAMVDKVIEIYGEALRK